LTKRFGKLAAVNGLGFEIAEGSVTGVLGGNGAGKSTTLGMTMGLILPTSRQVKVLGFDMAGERYRALSREFREPLCRIA
jgi:ABC-2 type transport system ATP-binding protein